MIRFWNKRIQTGILTENSEFDDAIQQIRTELKNHIEKHFAGSLAIRMVDSGSCNACEAECNALSNPYYDLERLGIFFVASPRHADVMLISGVLTFNMLPHVMDAWQQIAAPKWAISIGDCPAMQAPFVKNFAIKGPVDAHIPIAHHIKGCPPSPQDIIQGLLDFLKKIKLHA